MNQKILLITPPFMQYNCCYPAMPYIKGLLNSHRIESFHCDLNIALFNKIFSREFFIEMFNRVDSDSLTDNNTLRIFSNSDKYIHTIDYVIRFLKNQDHSLTNRIISRQYLPEAARFNSADDSIYEMFGTAGTTDLAKYLCTLYIEDIGDFFRHAVDDAYSLTSYASKLSASAHSFDAINNRLNNPPSLIEETLLKILNSIIQQSDYSLACFTVPFPGTLLPVLRCAKFVKNSFSLKTAIGGGFVSTELREVKDIRVFDYADYIVLDDGEAALLQIIDNMQADDTGLPQSNTNNNLPTNTLFLLDGKIHFVEPSCPKDVSQKSSEESCVNRDYFPDYSDTIMNDYVSLIDMPNPMSRLWNDGRWNKIMLCRGCYYAKCAFCDTSLSYVKNFQNFSTEQIITTMNIVMQQTKSSGFHFVDEASPPKTLRDISIEILKQNMSVSFWANIRFEKYFTADICRLLAKAGCIAVSGGLEGVLDRLNAIANKGLKLKDLLPVLKNFSDAGILVHGYLIHALPGETEQEIIDALEIVRQLYLNGFIQSSYYHTFSLTAHSGFFGHLSSYPLKAYPPDSDFAFNDIPYKHLSAVNYFDYEEGLNLAVNNFMKGLGLDVPVTRWFKFTVPKTSIDKDFVLKHSQIKDDYSTKSLLWLGNKISIKDNKIILTNNFSQEILKTDNGSKIAAEFINSNLLNYQTATFKEFSEYLSAKLNNPENFLAGKNWSTFREMGLLLI